MVGHLHPTFKPHRGFFGMNAWPHHGAFAAFPKQNDKCPHMPKGGGGGGWERLELTEPLSNCYGYIQFCINQFDYFR